MVGRATDEPVGIITCSRTGNTARIDRGHHRGMRRRPRLAALLATGLAAALAPGCGGDEPDRPSATTHASATPDTPIGRSDDTADVTADEASGDDTDCVGQLGPPEEHRYRADLADVAPRLQSLDVYRRDGATGCPVLVWVHGGGWRRGDKQGNGVEEKAALAGELGAVLVSVNYRLSDPGNSVRWPDHGVDVAAAVAWTLAHADELGIDPDRVALMGHSAGAHLVSIVGTSPDLLADAGADRGDLDCVVSLDSAGYAITPDQVADGSGIYATAFGGDPATLADASPLTQVVEHPDGVPDFLLVTRGAAVRVAEVEAFADAVAATGAAVQVVDAAGYSHSEVNTRLGADGEHLVTDPARGFLSSCFAAGSESP